MKGPDAILVAQASATHNRSWENKAHHIQAINRDHSQLVKFRANDEAYRRILGTLKEFTKQASTMRRGRKIELEECKFYQQLNSENTMLEISNVII